jgi:hypothetical protein
MLSAVSAKPESCFRLPLQITFKPLHGRCAGDTLCTAVAQEKQSFLLSPEVLCSSSVRTGFRQCRRIAEIGAISPLAAPDRLMRQHLPSTMPSDPNSPPPRVWRFDFACLPCIGYEPEHELPAAEVGPDPSGGCIGRDYHRFRSLRSGAGSASRRMGARRQRTGRARRHHRRLA